MDINIYQRRFPSRKSDLCSQKHTLQANFLKTVNKKEIYDKVLKTLSVTHQLLIKSYFMTGMNLISDENIAKMLNICLSAYFILIDCKHAHIVILVDENKANETRESGFIQ